MRRREFLKLVAASGAGAVLFTGCELGNPEREFEIQSPVLNPEDLIFDRDTWFATAFPGISGGSGLIVRVFEGRAKKIEGNPDYPINLGRSTALEQSLVQELYHPDRIGGPLQLANGAARGSGEYTETDWVTAQRELATAIDNARGQILLITGSVSGTMAALIREFTNAFDARHIVYEPDERVVLRQAMQRVFGTDRLPTIDLANSNFLLNFGADFIHGWISPVQLAAAYGEFRQGREDVRGLYYHVGPQLSSTGSAADRWFPIRPGSEGLVALAIAQVITSEGLGADGVNADDIYGGISLDDYTPETVAEASGVSAEQIREIAQQFAGNGPSVAIAGGSAAAHTNGLFNLSAVYALNYLVGSVGSEGGILLNPPSPLPDELPASIGGASYQDWQQVIADMNNNAFDVVLVHGANPIFGLPAASGFVDALSLSVGSVFSFSSFMDETTAHANFVLPDHTTLENWGVHVPDPGPGFELVGLQQPVVRPFVGTQAFGDTLIQAAAEAGEALPWASYEEAVRASVAALQGLDRGNVEGDTEREFFVAMQAQGGWWAEDETADDAPDSPTEPLQPADPQFAGDAGEYPFYLHPFPTNSLGYGEYSHLPWLQALPEPISTNVWTSWVELSQSVGDEMGLTNGDVVRIESPEGSLELPVYINPAAAPDLVLIPIGQGHENYTRYAEGRGENPISIVVPEVDQESGALAWAGTRVRIEYLNRRMRIPRFEGYVDAYQIEHFPIIRVDPSDHDGE